MKRIWDQLGARLLFLFLMVAVVGTIFLLAWRDREASVQATQTAVQVAAADTPTAIVIPTFTPIPTVTETVTPGPSPTPSQTPKPTLVPTATPTAAPLLRPTLPAFEPYPGLTITDTTTLTGTLPIPTQVPTFDVPDGVVNILLMGKDATEANHTDTLIIVSINKETQTAAMVSLPRDLFVYVPGKVMSRINTALTLGGPELLVDTILYNLGIPIDYWAQVDFNGFVQIVDSLGGIDLAVTCGFTDFRLISPELDPEEEENWELYTLEPGIHHMDGDLALWYVRSRNSATGDDYGRGRRQQQLLRALFNKGIDLDLVPQVPALYQTYKDTVDTNMDIGAMLQLAAIAPQVRQNGIQNLYLKDDVTSFVTSSGANVLLPKWETMQVTLSRLFVPPVLSNTSRPAITIEILNATGDPELPLLAADNLAWYGFVPLVSEETRPRQAETTIRYYAANFKASYDWLISTVMGYPIADIELVPNTPSDTNYQITLGSDYDPCISQFYTGQ